MILTWLSYLSKIGSGEKYKIEDDFDGDKKPSIPLFFVCPMKQAKLTTIKAPMAHKTFSQEQFRFRFYSFNISFNINNSLEVSKIDSLNQSLCLALMIRSNFLNFSTNLMFVKRFRASLPVSDKRYLTLQVWINKYRRVRGPCDEIGRHARLKTLSGRVLVQVQVRVLIVCAGFFTNLCSTYLVISCTMLITLKKLLVLYHTSKFHDEELYYAYGLANCVNFSF